MYRECDRVNICRSSQLPVFSGLYATTATALNQSIHRFFPHWHQVFSDLSLGAWQSHQVAAEFSAQLGLALSMPDMPSPPDVQNFPSYADTIGTGIDAEATGDRSLSIALAATAQIATALMSLPPQIFLVIAPRFSSDWGSENLRFLEFLAHALVGTQSRLVVICADVIAPESPAQWSIKWLNQPQLTSSPEAKTAETSTTLLRLIPGIVEAAVLIAVEAVAPQISAQISAQIHLQNGHSLIAPEHRQPPQKISRIDYDKLGTAVSQWRWIDAYSQVMGNTFYSDPLFLCHQGWDFFSQGSYHLALRLLEKALSISVQPEERGRVQAQLQGMRIASQRFQAAANSCEPSPSMPTKLQGFLWQAKAWGLVMTQATEAAEKCLQQATGLQKTATGDRESLYLLNISALNQLKLGRLEEALRIEQEIEKCTEKLEVIDYHLVYVNSLNLARLYTRSGALDLAQHYYERAFMTTDSIFTESDLVYANICFAKLNHQRGRHTEELFSWIRASLYWLSSSLPEAIGPRVIRSLLPLAAEKPISNRIEAFSSQLFEHLLEAIQLADIFSLPNALDLDETLDLKTQSPVFVRAERLIRQSSSTDLLFSAGGTGWNVLGSSKVVLPPFNGRAYQRLGALLYQIFQTVCPICPWQKTSTVAVDGQVGYQTTTLQAALSISLRYGVSEVVFDNRLVDLSEQDELEKYCLVTRNEAISQILTHHSQGLTQKVVLFKRYLPARMLSQQEARILDSLARSKSLLALADRLQVPLSICRSQVRSLENENLVRCSLVNYPISESFYAASWLVSSRL